MSSRYNTLCLPSIKLPLADPKSPLGAFGAPGLLGAPRASSGLQGPPRSLSGTLGALGAPRSSYGPLRAPSGPYWHALAALSSPLKPSRAIMAP